MASYKRRQSSDYNQSVPETQFVPEQHAYQEKHFQPVLNQPVSETHAETEYGSTVTPDNVETRAEKNPRSTVNEKSDQPGETDLANGQVEQNIQGNSDPGTQYSTPDVSSGVSSGPGGLSTYGGGTVAAASSTAATTVVASSAAATVSSVAITTVGAAVIAATLILPLVIGVPSAIIFDEISVTDTTVYYSIYFEDYEEDMELIVSLHNNFTNRSHTVESQSISILEENLKPGMDYKITVYGRMGTVLEERTVTTDKDSSESTFTVSSAEFSMSDGQIHLTASLDDKVGKWSDYSMVFYDVKGDARTEVKRVPVSDFSSEVTMLPGLAKDTSVDGILAVECTEGGEKKVLYEKEMTAYSNPYIGFKTPPRFVDGTITVACDIVDSESVRTNYHAVVYVANAKDNSEYYDTDGSLVDGVFTATGVPTYPLHTGLIKVTWDEEGGGDVLFYQYDTISLGMTTMTNETTEYGGDSYEVKFTVEISLVDDFNYLTDSSGEWKQSMLPTLTSDMSAQSTLDNVFYEIRRTGDNTYVATFLAMTWTEATMYRLDNTFTVDGYDIEAPVFTSDGYAITINREANGDMSTVLTFRGPGRAYIDSASLVGSDGSVIPCTLSSSNTDYYFSAATTALDPNDTYTIYFYNINGKAMFRAEGLTFENPPVMTSAIYDTQGKIATVVFSYPGTSVIMPDYPQSTVTATGETLTLVFGLDDPDIVSGNSIFRFQSSDTKTYLYCWKAVFTET